MAAWLLGAPVLRNPKGQLMIVVFETSRFRVHITGHIAWFEMRESSGWVLREQFPIPVPSELLSANAHLNALGSAVLEFEASRPGDTSLRAALTGYRKPAIAQALPRPNSRTNRVIAKPFWSREPLRPPLAIRPA
jgi:hypothetical protein